jgi:hypothetical protein
MTGALLQVEFLSGCSISSTKDRTGKFLSIQAVAEKNI